MRFAEKGYYVEDYIKCKNCGVLVYDVPASDASAGNAPDIFCSDWCREWSAARDGGDEHPVLPLPR